MAETPLIELNDVVKTLGLNRVLDGINLNIRRGEITAIIGKSGSGKSVLLKHIIGLLEPDGGTIRFNGKIRSEMSPADRKALKQKFSYVFQDTALFDFLNVLDNVALPLVERKGVPRAEIERRVREKLHQLDLHDIEQKYPAQLSGGMKKRVALARALVTDPEIVLFDEPTTGLDPIRKNAVHSMILNYQRRFGFTGVVVSHEIPDIFFIAQRVAMIDEGRIRFEGTPDEIQQASDPGVRNFIEGLESPRDDLTGATSHSIGQKRLLQELSRLQRHEIPFSIVLLAMDHLEGIDRIEEHEAGQTVFKAFANYVTQNTYITDTCFRYDINKILVVLPDTSEQQARDFCRKISRAMENNALFDSIESAKGFSYSVRAGVAQAHKDSGLGDLIAQAQQGQALFYECRNRPGGIMRQSSVELGVGVFVLLGFICLGYLTFRLGEVEILGDKYYLLNARFMSVTGLKVGAQVEIAGVQVGQVDAIVLDPKDLVAMVRLKIKEGLNLSDDVIASVKSAGLLGDKYIQLSPGGSDRVLKPGEMIIETEPALDIEALISKYAFGKLDKTEKPE